MWGAFLECGCLVGAASVWLDPVTLGEAVSEWRKAGLEVREVTADFARQNLTEPDRCPHRPQQFDLF